VSLVGQDSQAGTSAEQFVNLLHERLGPGQVTEREMGADQVDPGLDGELRHCEGQEVPQALRADQFLARRRDVAAAAAADWLAELLPFLASRFATRMTIASTPARVSAGALSCPTGSCSRYATIGSVCLIPAWSR
jgi:hypothetical protein